MNAELIAAAQCNRGTVWRYVSALEKAGYVEKSRLGARGRVYVVVLRQDPGAHPPVLRGDGTMLDRNVQRSARQRAWQSMRVFGEFCARDIEATAQISRASLRDFLKGLARWGYIRAVRRVDRQKCWLLVRNTGPMAPRIRAKRRGQDASVIERNKGEL